MVFQSNPLIKQSVLKFGQVGRHLGSRVVAASLREKIALSIRVGHSVVLDFDGVITMSDSFADECFGKLTLDFDLTTIYRLTSIINAPPIIKFLIKDTLNERTYAFTEI